MGLTVHFKLAAPSDCSAAQAKRLVESMRRVALRFQREGLVDRVLPISSEATTLRRFARDWLILPVPGSPRGVSSGTSPGQATRPTPQSEENTSTGVEVCPAKGFLFRVDVGEDCEPLWLGLCRYPETVLHHGRELQTKIGSGWRLAGFSKTQYASLHGWEHFQRCHCAVVNLLAACRTSGLRVKISDEGDYWPARSLTGLRQNLDQMNGLMEARAARVAAQPEKMQLRKQRCEHPFGTIKRWFGYSYFLVKGLEKVRCEWHLMTLAYNLKRGLNLVSFEKLMAAVGVKLPQSA